MVRRALIPGTVEAIEIDDENTIIRATVKDEEKAKVLGRGGTNINIAGDLLGYRISLTTLPPVEGITSATETIETEAPAA